VSGPGQEEKRSARRNTAFRVARFELRIALPRRSCVWACANPQLTPLRLGSDTIASLAVAAITELKETRDASPGFATEVDDAFSHDTVLSAILNPALQLVNTVDELTVLKGGSVGEKWDKAIEDKIERLLSAAIEVQVGAILESLGIKDVDAGNARGAFETFNAKMVDFAAPTFDEINQTKARMTARRRVLERIVEEYGRVWSEFGEAGKAVHSPDALRQILN